MKRMTRTIEASEIANQEAYAVRLREHYGEWSMREGREATFCIRTFGCQQNESDSEIMRALLRNCGLKPEQDYESADLVLINTCSVRENADDRLFGHLGKLKALAKQRGRGGLTTIVCGCMMTQDIHREKIRSSYPNVDILFGPHDLWRLPELLWKHLQGERHIYLEDQENSLWEGLPVDRTRKYRALVSIMYGCNNFCTFCIVPHTRGRERSREAWSILAELRELAAEGYREVMLLGQNVNAWGTAPKTKTVSLDCSPEEARRLDLVAAGELEPQNFAELLTAAAQIPGLERIRYMSSHPRDFSGQLIEVLRRYDAIEQHLHLPMQSGSNAVLKKMNRYYDIERFAEIIERVRAVRPKITLSTDIIVGFPTETEEDFEDTLKAVERFRFDSAFTFIYSPRVGTPAAKWEQVPEDVQHARFDRLAALQNRLSLEGHQALVGQELRLLLEGLSGGDKRVLTGRDSGYHLINVTIPAHFVLPPEAYTADGALNGDFFEGKMAQVRVTEGKTYSAEGELLALES